MKASEAVKLSGGKKHDPLADAFWRGIIRTPQSKAWRNNEDQVRGALITKK
jgi:hypothetical protein